MGKQGQDTRKRKGEHGLSFASSGDDRKLDAESRKCISKAIKMESWSIIQ